MPSKCYEGAHIRSLLAAAAVVISRGGKRRAEIEASRVYVGRRADVGSTLPTQGPRVRETGDRRRRIQPRAAVSARRVHDEAGH